MPSTPRTIQAAQSRPHRPSLVVPAEELARLRDRYPNVLIVGPAEPVETALADVQEMLREPIRSFWVTGQSPLPLRPAHGTLIIRDVHLLGFSEQQQLAKWLAQTAGVSQVVATSPEPVLPLVESGRFLEVLYYRLNLAYFEVGLPEHAA
jgi:hypothetical protein